MVPGETDSADNKISILKKVKMDNGRYQNNEY